MRLSVPIHFHVHMNTHIYNSKADAFSVGALAVSVAVGHFTFVVFETAFFALPARIALALAIDVVTASAAQDGTDTYCQTSD